jgi:uncharacterized protein
MAVFGEDFRRAKQQWLYDVPKTQRFWVGLSLAFALFVLHTLVYQTGASLIVYKLVFGGEFASVVNRTAPASNDLIKSAMVGIGPAAVVTCMTALWFARASRLGTETGLALRIPQLGIGGWAVVLLGFVAVMYASFVLTFVVLQIDPQTYAPGGGLEKSGENAGMVERTMAELSNYPILFLIALPGVAILVPAAEELIFRGVLFNALVHSPVGKVGAVLITAATWAVIHRLSPAPWLFVGVIFVMGIVLGILLLRFGSLWVTIACHIIWNTVNSLAIFGLAK